MFTFTEQISCCPTMFILNMKQNNHPFFLQKVVIAFTCRVCAPNMVQEDFTPAMFFQKCQTSKRWSICGSSFFKYFRISIRLSVVSCFTTMPFSLTYFNVFIRFEFAASVTLVTENAIISFVF